MVDFLILQHRLTALSLDSNNKELFIPQITVKCFSSAKKDDIEEPENVEDDQRKKIIEKCHVRCLVLILFFVIRFLW